MNYIVAILVIAVSSLIRKQIEENSQYHLLLKAIIIIAVCWIVVKESDDHQKQINQEISYLEKQGYSDEQIRDTLKDENTRYEDYP